VRRKKLHKTKFKTLFCHRCGVIIKESEDTGSNIFYYMNVKLISGYTPLNINLFSLYEKDYISEINRLIKLIESRTEQDLLEEIFTGFRYTLCKDCQIFMLKGFKNPGLLFIKENLQD